MEPKKHQNLELNRNGLLYFLLGMATMLLLAYVSLEWKTYQKTPEWAGILETPDILPDEMVPVTKFELPKPKPIHTPPMIEIVPDNPNIIDTPIASTESDLNKEVIEVKDVVYEKIEEDPIIPIHIVEEVPIFPGCENAKDQRACFQEKMQKHIRKHFKYPEMAQEMGLQGRVNIVFTIQKDGSISEVRMRGPHEVLEKEAERIISKLPTMTPGKQRGTPVKVPFSIPITFKLH